jgi:hypothetical protein
MLILEFLKCDTNNHNYDNNNNTYNNNTKIGMTAMNNNENNYLMK